MKCPKCATPLVHKSYKGMMEVECCPNCRGMWLDFHELDQLEDLAFDKDHLKGSLIHREKQTDFPCPHCGEAMVEFQYRLYNLHLDLCANNEHGFWLDAGEDERVLAIMRQRAEEMRRKLDVETEWRLTLRKMREAFRENR
jgi:Zn-finger nucleic acid-binding protein